MNTEKSKPQNYDLETLKQKLEQWRKTKSKHSRIPENLWDAAVELCKIHSITKVSDTLKICSYNLKRRLNCKNRLLENSGIAIEMERPDGTTIRMNLKGQLNPHQIEIAKSFWQAQ